jgi:hypothetical protein
VNDRRIGLTGKGTGGPEIDEERISFGFHDVDRRPRGPIFNDGNDDGFPDIVTGGTEVELVADVKFRAQLAGGSEEGVESIGIMKVGMSGGMFADAFVERALLVDEIRAAGAGLDREIKDVGVGEIALNATDEISPIGEDLVNGFAGSEIVVTFVKKNEGGIIGRDDAVVKEEDVAGLGAAEAAIQNIIAGESGGEGIPADDGGGAENEDGVGRGRIAEIFLFEGADGGFERVGLRQGGEESRKNEWESAKEKRHDVI